MITNNSTSNAAPRCTHCGSFPHQGVCPLIRAIEYHPDGSIKRVEYKTANDYPPLKDQGPWPVTCSVLPDAPSNVLGNL